MRYRFMWERRECYGAALTGCGNGISFWQIERHEESFCFYRNETEISWRAAHLGMTKCLGFPRAVQVVQDV
jgi:hypothetical protein